jgi:ElaB/YqjD/DUF883 family membrane-anchored ribosome-binding protein
LGGDLSKAQGIQEIRAELKAEKKFHSTMKNLEMQTIEANSGKLVILKEKKILENFNSQLKEELQKKDEALGEMKRRFEEQFKEASARFNEEYEEVYDQMNAVKTELEKYREYKIKFEFIEKDYKGTRFMFYAILLFNEFNIILIF